jgi:hypothetical protein
MRCTGPAYRFDANKPHQIPTEAVLKRAAQCPDGALRQPDKKKPYKEKPPQRELRGFSG